VRVALTGATGYTGGHLLRTLIARGDQVSALARDGSLTDELRVSGARWVSGDLRDEAALRTLVEDADAVLHVAAVYRTAGHPDSYYREINVGGTARLLEAAVRQGVRRFVHTSTVGVHGHVEHPPADETAPFAPGDIYQATKAEAEALALDFHRRHGVPVAVVRPGAIYGPGETRFLKLFRAIARGRYAIVGTGRTFYHPVYIDDLVSGFLLALDRPEAVGEAFFLASDERSSVQGLMEAAGVALGVATRRVDVPAPVLSGAAALADLVTRFTGKRLPLNRKLARQVLAPGWVCDTAKAKARLGFTAPTPLADSMARAARWYLERGWL